MTTEPSEPQRFAEKLTLNGIEYERSIQHRCINIGRHFRFITPQANCPCHQPIPMPCPDCYAIEVLTRDIPWSALGWPAQEGAAGTHIDGSVAP